MEAKRIKKFNMTQLVINVTKDLQTAIAWSQEKGLISKHKICPKCRNLMRLRHYPTGKIMWRCHKRTKPAHDVTFSALRGTFFENSKLGIQKILTLAYLFSVGETNYDRLIDETSDATSTTSRRTIADWTSYCREVFIDWIDNEEETAGQIGGEGKIVEIDETVIGKRKFKKGRLVEGCWVLGMMEVQPGPAGTRRGGSYRLEVCPNNKRDAATVLPVIAKHVAPKTTIVTDLWRAHFGLGGEGYYYFLVNNSQEFVNPATGSQTQTIKSSWRHLKTKLTGSIQHADLGNYLAEYLYRREVKLRNLDPFLHFVSCAAKLYPPE